MKLGRLLVDCLISWIIVSLLAYYPALAQPPSYIDQVNAIRAQNGFPLLGDATFSDGAARIAQVCNYNLAVLSRECMRGIAYSCEVAQVINDKCSQYFSEPPIPSRQPRPDRSRQEEARQSEERLRITKCTFRCENGKNQCDKICMMALSPERSCYDSCVSNYNSCLLRCR